VPLEGGDDHRAVAGVVARAPGERRVGGEERVDLGQPAAPGGVEERRRG
jgi:hypothetical protein